MDLGLDPLLFWDMTPRLLVKLADRHLARHGVAKREEAQTEEEMMVAMDAWVTRTRKAG